jgi:hypothetical protein
MENQMKTYQINEKEIATLAAARVELGELCDEFEDILSYRVLDRVRGISSKIRLGLHSIQQQQEREWDRKHDYFEKKGRELDLYTTWSIYEVDDLDALSGITAKALVYNGWGEATVQLPPGDKTWAQLWVYAEQALRDADDMEHGFIESFEVDPAQPMVVRLRTGS